ncbi:hypothetical protein ACFWF3_09140 [Nocardia sp. NPDC060220]|uniref:hypothetical protein n=1 Tax=Nocardia sp. NPDC060220 TaxID=3347076 RepID=UPI003664EE6B
MIYIESLSRVVVQGASPYDCECGEWRVEGGTRHLDLFQLALLSALREFCRERLTATT